MQVAPWSSFVDVGFWSELAKRKLERYRLNDEARPLVATFGTGNAGKGANAPALICLSAESLDTELDGKDAVRPPAYQFAAPGTLRNYNSHEEFKAADKAAVLASTAAQVWEDIHSGAALAEPSRLNRFAAIAYADLKNWRFHYWFCFPALLHLPDAAYFADPVPLSSALSPAQVEQLREGYDRLRGLSGGGPGAGGVPPPFFLAALRGGALSVEPLSARAALADADEVLLGFADPCGLPGNPGWPLRNLLALAAARWGLERARIGGPLGLCALLRAARARGPPAPAEAAAAPKAAGWERNGAGALAPRLADLGPVMDPARLAEGAVDLNVRLMRWRLAPDIQPDRVAATKCLLLGAGTLGCAVARCLLGWGVRHVTFVDSGRVAYSNPVRQSLFTFADCAGGGAPKAPAAASRLAEVFPGVTSRGVQLSIPMPGHPIAEREREAAAAALRELDALVAEHDVVFLLTDTRESRWLPTLLAAAHGKLAINSALGFDSYLVMRHGTLAPPAGPSPSSTPSSSSSPASHQRLGCYFCNDVVAPTNSVADRTLDQQCTVTRPGLAFMAGAAAVELAVALLHHPQALAAAPRPPPRAPRGPRRGRRARGAAAGSPLGSVPHQIRGFLSHWTTALVTGRGFDQCTACSPGVVAAYRARGFELLLDACNSPRYLEELTGLGELQRAAEAAAAALDADADADGGEGSGDDF
eukprot:tig00021318_g20176.t1